MSTVAVPALVVAIVAARPVADVLTGSGPTPALDAAEDALPWMVVAGIGQFSPGSSRARSPRSTTTSSPQRAT